MDSSSPITILLCVVGFMVGNAVFDHQVKEEKVKREFETKHGIMAYCGDRAATDGIRIIAWDRDRNILYDKEFATKEDTELFCQLLKEK